ncbi:hypothetical protein KEM55_003459 [Ascosphaera atra]|nr:hypothetical protein KEM55_003459 [Ascosphaera atra]
MSSSSPSDDTGMSSLDNKTSPAEDVSTEEVQGPSLNEISNDAEYAQWYSNVRDDLLEASFDEYQYDTRSPTFSLAVV